MVAKAKPGKMSPKEAQARRLRTSLRCNLRKRREALFSRLSGDTLGAAQGTEALLATGNTLVFAEMGGLQVDDERDQLEGIHQGLNTRRALGSASFTVACVAGLATTEPGVKTELKLKSFYNKNEYE